MGCQRKIAEKIISKKADYILQVKDNQFDTKQQMMLLMNLINEDMEILKVSELLRCSKTQDLKS